MSAIWQNINLRLAEIEFDIIGSGWMVNILAPRIATGGIGLSVQFAQQQS